MTVVYVGDVDRGAADGTSRANCRSWLDLNTAIQTAAGGSSPHAVLMRAEDTYLWNTSGQAATIASGGSSYADRVEVLGVDLAENPAYARIYSDRSDPYVPPPPPNSDVWAPAGDGDTGLIIWNLAGGAENLRFHHLAFARTNSAIRVQDPISNVDLDHIICRNVRRLWEMGGDAEWQGSASQHINVHHILAHGFSKQFFQVLRGAYMDFYDILLDGELQMYDGIASGVDLVGNAAGEASHHITHRLMSVRNCVNPGYIATPQTYQFAVSGGIPSGGTFTWSCNGETTAAVAFDAAKGTIKAAIAAAFSWCIEEDIFITGTDLPTGPLTIEFGWNTLDSGPPAAVTINPAGLTGGSYALSETQAWAALQPDYWQGDGFTSEEHDYAIRYQNCEAITMGDGGWDLKSASTDLSYCKSIDCKRSVRNHPSLGDRADDAVVVSHHISVDPQLRVYGAGTPLAGTPGTGSQNHFQTNGRMKVIEPHVIDTMTAYKDDSIVFNADDTDARIAVIGGFVERSTGSTLDDGPAGSVRDLIDVTDSPS